MRDQENPLRNFIDSTRKCCSSLGGLVSSLISRHCRVLVGSPSHSPSEREDNYSSEMEPIDISSTDSDSDSWDVAKYKALNDMDDSALGDSASSTNARVLPMWESSSSTGVLGHSSRVSQKVPSYKKAPELARNSINLNNRAHGQLQIHPSSSDNVRISNSPMVRDGNSQHGLRNEFARRALPASLQASGPSARPGNTINGADGRHNRETYGYGLHLPRSNVTLGKSSMNDYPDRGRDDEVVIYGNGSSHRRLPLSIFSPIPNTQHTNPSDPPPRSGVVEERAVDERVVYQALLQDLNQPKSEATLPDGLLSVTLLKHQKIALDWMHKKETKSPHCRGGILADDQGLGKTISMIALILLEKSSLKLKSDESRKPEVEALDSDDDGGEKGTGGVDEAKKTGESDDVMLITQPSTSTREFRTGRPSAGTLVVCPASVLRQWARELEEKVADDAQLEILVYHGGSRTKDPKELAKYDVVVTTYAIVKNEVPKQPLGEEDDDDLRNGERYGLSSDFSSTRKRKKGTNGSKRGKKGRQGIDTAAFDYDCGALARVRWSRVILDEAQTIKNHRTQVARSCTGLKAKMRWCLSGTPIQNSIEELYSYFRFLRYGPYEAYKNFCESLKNPISRDSVKGYKKLEYVLKTVMLRRTKGTLIGGEPIINLPPKIINLKKVEFSTEERAFYSKLEADSRSQFKAYAAAGTVNQNYANILLMLLRLRQACDHPLLVKGFNSDSVSRVSGKMAKRLPREMLIDLLERLETSLAICHVCSDPPEDAVVTMCGHVFCYQCISEYLTGDENTCPSPKCKEQLGVDAVFSKATLRSCISNDADDNRSGSSCFTETSKVLQNEYSSSKIRAALEIIRTHCRSKSQSSNLHTLVTCNGNSSTSEKSCPDLQAEGPIKAIVFSQWTRMLDLVEMSLNRHCIEYRRLDGTMSLASRDRAVKEFNTDPEVTVMLMSLKAGNLGLNMVAASHVILLDLWWNPTTEDQAVDRAHRIGQTRPVTVSRLTINDTVEDRILALQEEKRKMVASAFGEDPSGAPATRLTAEDLGYLFMGNY